MVAGFPETTAVTTLNRQCSSGLQALANIASSIKSGFIDIGIGAGVESMSLYDMTSSVGEINPRFFEHEQAVKCLLTMGQTSENVAEKYGISREIQDQFSLESQNKAAKAQKEGRFDAEIVPVETTVKTADGQTKKVVVSKDEGPRPTTIQDLTKLKPAFKEGGLEKKIQSENIYFINDQKKKKINTKHEILGSTTAGNSSQVSDGAAAVLAMRRSVAKKLGLTPIGVFRGYSGAPNNIF